MSYTGISTIRSHRYPLHGTGDCGFRSHGTGDCGCGCGPTLGAATVDQAGRAGVDLTMPLAAIVGAGIGYWLASAKRSVVTPNRRRRTSSRLRRNHSGPYELVYSTGGHGGPYTSLAEATDEAERRMKHSREPWIAIVPARDITHLTKAVAVAILHRDHAWKKGKSWLPNVPAAMRQNRRRSSRRRR